MTARRLTWPLKLEGGKLATHRADTITDVTQCVTLIVRTPLAARPLSPAVGIDDDVFNSHVDTGDLAERLAALEPRASVDVRAEYSDDGRTVKRSIGVTLRDMTNSPEVPA